MPTMAQAIREFVEAAGGAVTAEQVRRHIETTYPGQWQPRTLQAHLYGCVINNRNAYIHHPSAVRFLYKNGDGSFEMYSEQLHGPNEWALTGGEDEVQGLEEMIETSISLERDIEDHLVHHLDGIEKGPRVVIEVKVGEAKDSAVGQIARYLGWYGRADGKPARGILIAAEFPEGVRSGATAIPNLQLIAYRVLFAFAPATI